MIISAGINLYPERDSISVPSVATCKRNMKRAVNATARTKQTKDKPEGFKKEEKTTESKHRDTETQRR